jgi:hypothetical protein
VPIGPVQSLSVNMGGTMRLSWAQGVAGVLTCAVVAGLFLLPGRLLGPDQSARVAVPLAQAPRSVQAAPPLAIHHLRLARPTTHVVSTATPARRSTYVPPARTVVRVSPERKLLKAHRSAVISKLAPTAPLVQARVLAAVAVKRHALKPASSTAKTIAALTASLRTK